MSADGGCWPTPEQELLLRATLLSGDAALAAWQHWQASVGDLGGLDHGSVRLLPLLYRNLKELGVVHPRMEILQGTYRKAWYQNRLLLHKLAETLRRLHDRGVGTMVLKGAALVATACRDIALRPMDDADVLVPVSDLAAAADVLRELGLHTRWDISGERHSVIHAAPFDDDRGFKLDLHWHALKEDCTAIADEQLRADAEAVWFEGVKTLAPAATEQLLHTCVHGVRWDPEPPLRWVADAAMLVNGGAINWERLVTVARRRRLALPLGAALAYAVGLLGLSVPGAVLAELAATPAAVWERRELRLQTQPLTELRRLRLHWYRHRRQRGGGGGLGAVASFPRYLRLFWGLRSLREVPRYLAVELPAIRRQSAAGR